MHQHHPTAQRPGYRTSSRHLRRSPHAHRHIPQGSVRRTAAAADGATGDRLAHPAPRDPDRRRPGRPEESPGTLTGTGHCRRTRSRLRRDTHRSPRLHPPHLDRRRRRQPAPRPLRLRTPPAPVTPRNDSPRSVPEPQTGNGPGVLTAPEPARSEAVIHPATDRLMARRLTGEATISWRDAVQPDEMPVTGRNIGRKRPPIVLTPAIAQMKSEA